MRFLDSNFVKNNAEKYFLDGYNCAQSLILAFESYLNISSSNLAKFTSTFGGGMCRLRETCGALSASLMIIGILFGYELPEENDKKATLYRLGQEFSEIFEREFGSFKCYKLLDLPEGKSDPTPSPRTKDYYETRPCKNIIGTCAFLLNNFIKDKM